jgi:fructose-specific phosphotransferase system IIC component
LTDLSDLPAVPPENRGGDERIGFRAGGIFLIVIGWGLGVIANILLHRMAPSTGEIIGPLRIYPTLGVYALGLVGLGAVAGVVGVFMIWLGQHSPRGKFVLPGYSYESAERESPPP